MNHRTAVRRCLAIARSSLSSTSLDMRATVALQMIVMLSSWAEHSKGDAESIETDLLESILQSDATIEGLLVELADEKEQSERFRRHCELFRPRVVEETLNGRDVGPPRTIKPGVCDCLYPELMRCQTATDIVRYGCVKCDRLAEPTDETNHQDQQMKQLYFVFDVESIGLHGEGFAFGYVLIDEDGQEHGSGGAHCDPSLAEGTSEGRTWISEHVPDLNYLVRDQDSMVKTMSPLSLRACFWAFYRASCALNPQLFALPRMAADVAWPVEARFLAACIDDDPTRQGPYPLIDIASVRLGVGLDPLEVYERLPYEQPAHHPLSDARQSARLLIEALRVDKRREIRRATRPEESGCPES